MRRSRPWRAAAYWPGPPRHWFGRQVSATAREGLDRAIEHWQALGLTVEVWEVQPIPEVAHLTDVTHAPQVADSSPGYVGAP